MQQTVEQGLTVLRELGTVEEIKSLADAGLAPKVRPGVNLHIHLPPNFSAFESIRQAVDLADQQGVGVLGTSNYYDFEVYGYFAAESRACGVFPIFGLEIVDCLSMVGTDQ